MTETISFTMNGCGYRYIHVRDSDKRGSISEPRLLMYAWGEIESVFFSKDMHEIHHINGDTQLNVKWNLMAVTPKEHMEIDENRAMIKTPWDEYGVDA